MADRSNKPVVIYQTEEEALAKTGHFSIFNLKITAELSDRLSYFIHDQNLSTFSQPNQKKTSSNTYTLNFTLKQYDFIDAKTERRRRYGYLSAEGALGYFSHIVHPPKRGAIFDRQSPEFQKYELLRERTPTFDQMYYWIARKYPRSILWMDYSHEKSNRPTEEFYKTGDPWGLNKKDDFIDF